MPDLAQEGSSGTNKAHDVAVTEDDSIIILSETYGSWGAVYAGGGDPALTKLSADGTIVWTWQVSASVPQTIALRTTNHCSHAKFPGDTFLDIHRLIGYNGFVGKCTDGAHDFRDKLQMLDCRAHGMFSFLLPGFKISIDP